MEYTRRYGQITFEAGALYKAFKSGSIKVLPETIGLFYDEKGYEYAYSQERYQQDGQFYDRAYNMAQDLISGNYEEAQKILSWIEQDQIDGAGRKSAFYKYKVQH